MTQNQMDSTLHPVNTMTVNAQYLIDQLASFGDTIKRIKSDEVLFDSQFFCITGKFESHSRSDIEHFISIRGGMIEKMPTLATHFVVLGSKGNEKWKHGFYGTKIEKALELKTKYNTDIAFIDEREFLKALSDKTALRPIHEAITIINEMEIGILDKTEALVDDQRRKKLVTKFMQIRHQMQETPPLEILPLNQKLECESNHLDPSDELPMIGSTDSGQQIDTNKNSAIANYLDRLRKLSSKSSFLQAYAGERSDRIDLASIDPMNTNFCEALLQKLLSSKSYTVTLDLRVKANIVKKLSKLYNDQFSDAEVDPTKEIQSILAKEAKDLEKKLCRFQHEVSQSHKETGINSLMLGYPIIHLPQPSRQALFAPLFLWPFSLVQKDAFIWQFSLDLNDGRHIIPNDMFTEALKDNGFAIESVKDHFFDDGMIEKKEIDQYLEYLAGILPNLHIATPFKIRSIKKANHYDQKRHPVVYPHMVLGLFSKNKGGIIRDLRAINAVGIETYRSLDTIFGGDQAIANTANPMTSSIHPIFNSDFSQRAVVRQTQTKQHTIVFGPPGTGKSQVIVEIIAQALKRNEKILICCDKATALDVIYQRLSAAGLQRMCQQIMDPRKDRTPLFKEIRELKESFLMADSNSAELQEKSTANQDASAELLAQKIQAAKDELNIACKKIHLSDSNDSALDQYSTLIQCHNQLPSYFSLESIPALQGIQPQEWLQAEGLLEDLSYNFEHSKLSSSQFSNIIQFDRLNNQSDIHIIETLRKINESAQDYITLSKQLGLKNLPFISEVESRLLEKISHAVSPQTLSILRTGFSPNATATLADLSKICANKDLFKKGKKIYHHCSSIYSLEIDTVKSHLSLTKTWLKRMKKWYFFVFFIAYYANYRKLNKIANTYSFKPKELDQFKEAAQGALAVLQAMHSFTSFLPLTLDTFKEIDEKVSLSETICKDLNLTDINELSVIYKNTDLLHLLTTFGWHTHALKSLSALVKLKYELSSQLRSLVAFSAFTDTASRSIMQASIDLEGNKVELEKWSFLGCFLTEHCKETNKQTIDSKRSSLVLSMLKDSLVLRPLGQLVFKSGINPTLQQWQNLYHIVKIKSNLSKMSELKPCFSSLQLTNHAKRVRDHEKLLSRHLLEGLSESYQRKTKSILGSYTSTTIRKKFALRGSFSRTLREAFHEDHTLLQTIKPVWLCTPDSACTIFPLTEGIFDIVVFDEASQCKIEEVLPVMVRGQTLVVSGDEYQMPPTRFFQKAFANNTSSSLSLNEESNDLADFDEEEMERRENEQDASEEDNLLSLAKKRHFISSLLRTHYRSQSHELIQFSNSLFYGSSLRIVPSGNPGESIQPIEFEAIAGIYHERVNEIEARRLVEKLKAFSELSQAHLLSYGIVVMNGAQKYLVWDLIDHEIAKNSAFSLFLDEQTKRKDDHEDRNLFIKTLEEVQGDERDIILIGTTYGPDRTGKFRRGFGPLNQNGGAKRLNVLVTRAKKSIVVITSIPKSEYSQTLINQSVTNHGANIQRQIFYAYLQYAEAISMRQQTKVANILRWLASLNLGQAKENILSSEMKNCRSEIIGHQLVKQLGDKNSFSPHYNFTLGNLNFDLLITCNQTSKRLLVDFDPYHATVNEDLEEYLDKVHHAKLREYQYFRVHLLDWWENQAMVCKDLIAHLQG